MKKLIVLSISFLIFSFCFAYEWYQVGPSGIKANKLCKISNSNYSVEAFIMVDSGIYIISDISTGEFYDFPIVDVCPYDYDYPTRDSVIVLINEGSYSDGIYSFHLGTHELQLLEFCYKPQFIELWQDPFKFFVGYEGGLFTSIDGLNWEVVPFFDQENCISISQYTYNAENIIVVSDNPTDNAFLLDEDGQNWHQVFGEFHIKEAYDKYGICRNADNEYGGIYEFDFNGQIYQWDEKINSAYLNCIGGSNNGNAFVGWHSTEDDDEGIAEVKYSFFQFKNEGLTNLNINHISFDLHVMGGDMIYCCTDEGAFWLDDTTVEIDDNESNQNISIFPNPASSNEVLYISCPDANYNTEINIYNGKGNLEYQTKIDDDFNQNFQVLLQDISAGIYYCQIKSDNGSVVKKLVVK